MADADPNNTSQVPDDASAAATVLSDLESLIKNHITDIDKRKDELKKQKEMLASALLNDKTYLEHEQKAKDANKVKAATKRQIMQQPANKQLSDKVRELSAEVKELDAALSDYLGEYQRLSGSNEIETNEGEVREIVYVAKLVRKPSRGK